MIAPTRPFFWQPFADGFAKVSKAFEMNDRMRHCIPALQDQSACGASLAGNSCSPSLRSGPSLTGPALSNWGYFADCVKSARNRCATVEIALEYDNDVQFSRGGSSCRGDYSSLCCWWSRLRAAWPIQPHVGWPVAGSSWACRPVGPATDLTAHSQMPPPFRTIRAAARVVFCFLSAERGSRCSRKS